MLTSKIVKQTIETCFNSILINHKITYEKTPFPPCSSSKVREAIPPLSDVRAYRYQQSQPRCITCQDVCVHRVTCDKTPNVV